MENRIRAIAIVISGLLICLIGFCVPFLAAGGHIAGLIQPLPLLSQMILGFGILSVRKGLHGDPEVFLSVFGCREPTEQGTKCIKSSAFLSFFASTHLVGLGYWINIFQHLADQNGVIGHLFSALVTNYVAGIFLIAVIADDETVGLRFVGVGITAGLAAIASAVAFCKFT